MSIRRSMTIPQSAQLAGVCRRTIYYWIRAGQLQTIRVGVSQRVLTDSLEKKIWLLSLSGLIQTASKDAA